MRRKVPGTVIRGKHELLGMLARFAFAKRITSFGQKGLVRYAVRQHDRTFRQCFQDAMSHSWSQSLAK